MVQTATTQSKGTAPAIIGSYGTMYYVTDMPQSVEFFRKKLHLSPAYESAEWTEFKTGDHSLCLHMANKVSTKTEFGILIWRVTNIREFVAQLKENGVKISQDIKEVHPGAYSADFKDPDGNIISVYEGP